MKKRIRNVFVYLGDAFKRRDIFIEDGCIADIVPFVEDGSGFNELDFNFNNCFVFPGFTDVHVHLREPGFFYKETMKTGTLSAARGGFTNLCTMPNLNPAPDNLQNLAVQLRLIGRDAAVHVYPYGTITMGEQGETLSDMAAMAPYVRGFSDDGKGVQCAELMRRAMQEAKHLDRIIVAHCEDESLLQGGYIHQGDYARSNGHRGISSESEWRQIERDLALVRETGVAYHVCHLSTKEGVDLIRRAKSQGLDVSCETAPHYLTMCDMDLEDDGRFKMNPPIRSAADRDALIEGLIDGTVDMIATDHAPHSVAEKDKGLKGSSMGVVGLETSFAVCYTALVKTGIISLEKLIALMHDAPNRRFDIGTDLAVGAPADLTIFDLETSFVVNPAEFISMGKASPFTGKTLSGRCLMTMVGGEIVWEEENLCRPLGQNGGNL